MARQLEVNERIIPNGMGHSHNPNGSDSPEFMTYVIVDADNAPETAETLNPNEWLERIGFIAKYNPNGESLPAQNIYRKISESAVNSKNKLGAAEQKLRKDIEDIFLKKYKSTH